MATKAVTKKKPSASKKTAPVKAKTTKTVASKAVVKPVAKTVAKVTTSSAAIVQSSSLDFGATLRSLPFWRSIAAEFIGTFLLTAVIIVGQGQPLYTLFALVGIVLLLGTTSGAYLNPALAIASWATRRISWLRAIGYIVFEIVGALVAYITINYFVGGATTETVGSTATIFKAATITSGADWFVLFSELLGTAIFAFAFANYLRSAQERLTSAFTYAAGFFVALMISFIAASYVGATAILNPAVAFSLQAVSWSWFPIAIYILAPIVGAVLGFVINDLLKGREAK